MMLLALLCTYVPFLMLYPQQILYEVGTRLEKSQNAQKHLTGTFNRQTGKRLKQLPSVV